MKKYTKPEVELLSFAMTDIMEGSDENETFLDDLTDIFNIKPSGAA